MTRKCKRKSAAAYVAATLILTGFLAQTMDCYRLRKTERRGGRKESEAAEATGLREGEIVFGRVPEKSSNASVEDDASYQADSAGSAGKTQQQEEAKARAAWMLMAPSLHCAQNQMKFRAVGSGVSHLAVGQGSADPMPLSQVPNRCGYNMQRNPFGLVMLVSYDGCNMVLQGGNYMLPLLWNGIPVSLLCPKPAATPVPAPQDPPTQQFFYPYPGLPTRAPITAAKPAVDPVGMSWDPWHGFPWSGLIPAPTPADSSSQAKVTHIPIVPWILKEPATPTKPAVDPVGMSWDPWLGFPWSGLIPAPTPADSSSQAKATHIPIVPWILKEPAKPAVDPAKMFGYPWSGLIPAPTPADSSSQAKATHIPIVPWILKEPAKPAVDPAKMFGYPWSGLIPAPTPADSSSQAKVPHIPLPWFIQEPATPTKPAVDPAKMFGYPWSGLIPVPTPADSSSQAKVTHIPIVPWFLKQPAAEPVIVPQSAQLQYNPFVSMFPLPTTPKPTTKPTVPQIPPHVHLHGHGPGPYYGR